jgi:hypothetical protein
MYNIPEAAFGSLSTIWFMFLVIGIDASILAVKVDKKNMFRKVAHI